jgi:2-succinyl-5-enolpyruvyl-6-hydroxy-3-cyclohexene-1-carboxylate synthase
VSASAEALHNVVATFVEGLVGSGIRHVSACPGSRSTPLAFEIARRPEIKLWMHLDERSAAYFGLGLARTLHEPVALLATSGTAAANFFPAVVEANLARVALVVLTGDRPHELRDNGAAQTIDQLRLYGSHAKWFFDLPEPDDSPEQRRLVASIAARAAAMARAEPAGAVHVNWPFREPLIPAQMPVPDLVIRVDVQNPRLTPSNATVTDLAEAIDRSPRGLIVVGPEDADADLAHAITDLAAHVGYPVLADGLSGLRWGRHDQLLVIDTYDAFLRSGEFGLEPEAVLRFGAIPTSKPLSQYLEAQHQARSILVDPGGWREPTNAVTDVVHADPRLLCEALTRRVANRGSTDWTQRWTAVQAATRRALDAHLSEMDELFEGKVFSLLGELLPENALVFAGNSMPVRDLDTFLPRSDTRLRCLSNRGANGIDGVVSSAFGASAARLGPVVLVIGDISFYHDLNGLLAARRHDLDLLVVLLNNDGGGIFSFLPQAEGAPEHFELLFGTPHGLDFRPLVEGYGGNFVRIHDWPTFSAAITHGLKRGGLQVVEVPTERANNVVQHRSVWRAVAEALQPAAIA